MRSNIFQIICCFLVALSLYQCSKVDETQNAILPPTHQSSPVPLELASKLPDYDTKFAVHRQRRLLASVDRYHIEIWNINNNELVRSLEKLEWGKPERCTFTEDGDYLRILTDQGQLLVWDIRVGKQIGTYEQVKQASIDNRYLLVANAKGSSRVIDLDNPDLLNIEIQCAKKGYIFSNNSRYFAHIDKCNSIVKVFDLHNGDLVHSIRCNTYYESAALGNSGKYIALQKDNNDWRIEIFRLEQTADEEPAITLKMISVADVIRFTAHDEYLCMSTLDRTIKILDLKTGELALETGGASTMEALVVDSTYIFYASVAAKAKILLEQSSLQPVDTFPLAFSIRAIPSNDGITFYNQRKPRKEEIYLTDFYNQTSDTVKLTNLGDFSLYHEYSGDSLLKIGSSFFDLHSLELIPQRQFYEDLGINQSEALMVPRRYSPSFKHYHTEDGVFSSEEDELIFQFTGKKQNAVDRRVYYSANDRILLTYNSKSEQLLAIDLEAGKILRESTYDYDQQFKIAPSGNFYLTYELNNLKSLRVHSLSGSATSPKQKDKFNWFSPISSLEISPNEEYLAVFIHDRGKKMLTIWSVQTGELVFENDYTPDAHKKGRGYNVEFSPNSSEVIVYVSGATLERRDFVNDSILWQVYPTGRYDYMRTLTSEGAFFHTDGNTYVMRDLNNGEAIWQLGVFDNCGSCYFVKSSQYPIVKVFSEQWADHFFFSDYPDMTITVPHPDSILDTSNFLARSTRAYLSK